MNFHSYGLSYLDLPLLRNGGCNPQPSLVTQLAPGHLLRSV